MGHLCGMIDSTVDLQKLNTGSIAHMGKNLGIEFIEITPDSLTARMPVDGRTRQPLGYMHGGASAALCETVGSTAAYLSIPDRTKQYCLGLELKINHLRAVKEGYVVARAKAIHLGSRTMLFEITVWSEDMPEKPVSFCTHTVAVLDYKPGQREQMMRLLEGFA